MNAFLTPLETRRINGSRKRQLLSPLSFYSDSLGHEVTAPKDFIYNGPSSPIIGGVGSDGERPAAIHDFMYSCGKYTRSQADKVFREALEVDGMGWFRRGYWWLGVRIFGGLFYGKGNDESNSPVTDPDADRVRTDA